MIHADVHLDFPQIEVKTSTLPCSGNFITMFWKVLLLNKSLLFKKKPISEQIVSV